MFFLVFTVILAVLGGFFGFRRGIAKEGVRLALWAVVFTCFCFLLPFAAEQLPVFLAGKFGLSVADTEQLVAELLKKSGILRRDTYLILPAAALLRSVLVPFLTVGFYWISWLLSGLVYLPVVRLCFKENENEKWKAASKAAGLVFGIVFALFGGMLTLYPEARLSTAIKEGDTSEMLSEKSAVVASFNNCYEGTPAQMIYRYTGMEWLAGKVHTALTGTVITEEGQNFWAEVPKAVSFCSGAYGVYSQMKEPQAAETGLRQQMVQTAESYFSFGFLSEENSLLLLRHLTAELENRSEEKIVAKLFGWVEFNSRAQVIGDIGTFGALLELLQNQGILEAVQEQTAVVLDRETGTAMIEELYLLSNAETVVPEFLNFIYSQLMEGEAEELLRTEQFVLDEQTKENVTEVVDVMCRLSVLLEDTASFTAEQKKEALDTIKELKDNEAVGLKNYTTLLRCIMNRL
ncbi:MAG: hypothetical protein ACI4FZ_02870 [Lachnospiraceae bacterium]